MGVYSNNRFDSVGNIDVVANESYAGGIGAQQILIENAENDMNMFNAILSQDINEAVGIKEGTLLESEREVLMEGTLSGIRDKILAGLKKVWEKIKGLFANFIKRFNTIIIRDNKSLVNKYRSQFLTKDVSKMKYKMYDKVHDQKMGTIKVPAGDESTRNSDAVGNTTETVHKWITDNITENVILEKQLGESIDAGPTTASEYAKEAKEFMVGTMESYDGNFSDSLKTFITSSLIDSKTALKAVTDAQRTTDTAFKTILNAIKSEERKNNDISDKAEAALELLKLNAQRQSVEVFQRVATMASSAALSGTKDSIASCRSVFSRTITTLKENAALDMLQEAVEYEVESDFEAFVD